VRIASGSVARTHDAIAKTDGDLDVSKHKAHSAANLTTETNSKASEPKVPDNVNDPKLLGKFALGAVALICVILGFARCYNSNKRHMDTRVRFQGPEGMSGERQAFVHDGRKVYEWDQSADGVMIYIPVPSGLDKSDLDVKILSKRIVVGKMGKPPFLSQEYPNEIQPTESHWRMLGKGELEIYLQKKEEGEWNEALLPLRLR